MAFRTSDQGSAVWKQLRAGCATGSKVDAVMHYLKNGKEGADRRDYRMQLVAERLTGMPVEKNIGRNGDYGTDTEGLARIAYESSTGVLVEQIGFEEHPEIDWFGVSSDGLVGNDGCVEIKCPVNSGIHLINLLKAGPALYKALMGEALDEQEVPIPPEYVPQVYAEIDVLQREWCDFVSFDPRFKDERLRLHVHRVYRDEAYIKKMRAEVVKFLEEVEDAVSKLLLSDAAPAVEEHTKQAATVEIA